MKAYRNVAGLVEIGSCEYNLPHLSKGYEVSLMIGGETRRCWRVAGLEGDPPHLVFNEEGRCFERAGLLPDRLWFFIPPRVLPALAMGSVRLSFPPSSNRKKREYSSKVEYDLIRGPRYEIKGREGIP